MTHLCNLFLTSLLPSVNCRWHAAFINARRARWYLPRWHDYNNQQQQQQQQQLLLLLLLLHNVQSVTQQPTSSHHRHHHYLLSPVHTVAEKWDCRQTVFHLDISWGEFVPPRNDNFPPPETTGKFFNFSIYIVDCRLTNVIGPGQCVLTSVCRSVSFCIGLTLKCCVLNTCAHYIVHTLCETL